MTGSVRAARLDAFSPDYFAARATFRDAARAAGARLEPFANPAPGPDGEALTTDVARLGPDDAERLLLVNCGTHGVEGFAGSATEVAWLMDGGALPDGVRAVLVHAVNPHGFAWLRRVTEDNVDLNRNFIDHDRPHPTNPEYDSLHPFICPERWDAAAQGRSDQAVEDYIRAHGAFAAQAVITRGQYGHADGLFYGGQRPTWSNRTFREILERFLGGARLVAFVDLHTGLGAYGASEIIAGAAGGRLRDWFGDGLTSPAAGNSSSAPLSGVIGGAVRQAAAGAEVVSITLEFGTYPVREVLRALQADNWLHLHGDLESPEGRAIKAETRKRLFPDEDDWKELVLVRGRQVLRRALAGLARG